MSLSAQRSQPSRGAAVPARRRLQLPVSPLFADAPVRGNVRFLRGRAAITDRSCAFTFADESNTDATSGARTTATTRRSVGVLFRAPMIRVLPSRSAS